MLSASELLRMVSADLPQAQAKGHKNTCRGFPSMLRNMGNMESCNAVFIIMKKSLKLFVVPKILHLKLGLCSLIKFQCGTVAIKVTASRWFAVRLCNSLNAKKR